MPHYRKHLAILGIGLTLAVAALVAIQYTPAAPIHVEAGSVEGPPERIVRSFYGWFLDAERDPLADGSYRRRHELTAACIARIDAALAHEADERNPLFCGPEVLRTFAMDPPNVEDDTAQIVLHAADGTPRVVVELLLEHGAWRIDRIACAR